MKLISSFIFFFSLLISGATSLHAEYQLGGDEVVEKKKPRVSFVNDDFKYPMAFANNIYDFVMVSVYGTAAPGTGVIIAKKDNYYYLLTANHVVGEILKGDQIEIQTLDGKYHEAKLLKFDKEVDGALLKFKSNNKYYPAFIDPRIKPKTSMYILVQGYALASKEAKKGSLRRALGPIITVIDDNKDGYDIFYDAATNVGMSGGGVFTHYGQTKITGDGLKKCTFPEDIKRPKSSDYPYGGTLAGQVRFHSPILVGIHGRAESYRAGGKSGASMGISVHTLLSKFGKTLASEGITSLPGELDTMIYKDGCPAYIEARKEMFLKD